MQIIRGLHNFKPNDQGSVVTVGNFDGVHLGHQAIIKQLKQQSKTMKLKNVMMIFEPQPEEVFAKDENIPARLTRLREKIEILQTHEIDQLLIVPFNKKLADLTAGQFVQHILFERLNTQHLVIGDDFHFGQNRLGDFNYLKEVAEQFQFTVESISTVVIDPVQYLVKNIPRIKQRISSTWVRKTLQEGNLAAAKQLLGRHYAMCGRIVHGNQIGQTLDIPTINLHLHRKKSPLFGVYVVEVEGLSDHPIKGVANIGIRPTIQNPTHQVTLETYLFDFHQNIYDHYAKIVFLHKLRDEKKFESLDALKNQIMQDIEAAKKFSSIYANEYF
jgi:riboflavin kinase/FMN adenylyltransferase